MRIAEGCGVDEHTIDAVLPHEQLETSRALRGIVCSTARACTSGPLRKGSHSASLSFSIQRYGSLSVSPKYVSFTTSTRATGAGGIVPGFVTAARRVEAAT